MNVDVRVWVCGCMGGFVGVCLRVWVSVYVSVSVCVCECGCVCVCACVWV